MNLVEFLQRLPYFAGLPIEELERLCSRSEERSVEAGEVLLEEGSLPDAMYVVLSGEFEVLRHTEGGEVVIGQARAGDVLGEMALLEGAPRSASARATVAGRVASIGEDEFRTLLGNPVSVLAMLHTVTHRLRTTEASLRDTAKLAALGTMTAGLLHELNNPAAAVRRAAVALADTFESWRSLAAELERPELLWEAGPKGSPPDDLLVRADREGEIEAWLEARGVAEAWELAPPLVTAGWEVPNLDDLVSGLDDHQAVRLVTWLGLTGSLEELLEQLRTGARRISELVGAVKSYSYQGQAPVQEVDVRRGLEDTLLVLKHRLAPGIEVVRDYQPDLPTIECFGAELNQVWTNLIDNALDALGGEGTLELRAQHRDDRLVVEVLNTGPEMPSEVRARIFEPFFTTKPPGQGTGLGLWTSYNVVTQHGGEIAVSSEDGKTLFRVTLPLRLGEAA